MFKDFDKKEWYFELMRCLEQQNEAYARLLNSKECKTGSFALRLLNCIKTGNWKSIRGYFRNRRWNKKIKKTAHPSPYVRRPFQAEDYFSDERIAVYTSVFGKYDRIQEPLFKADNIDYFIVTDQEVPENSMWKKIPHKTAAFDERLSNAEKSRYFKMKPEVLFENYKYSIYVDGNIKIISDLTPYTKLLGDTGIGFHAHSQRNCSYKELEAIKMAYKAKKEDADSYAAFLKEHRFPKDYGLLECGVIVREHNNPICKKVMDEWWLQFMNKIKRDQVSLPFILFNNHISVEQVAVLGQNIFENYSFRIDRHS